VTATLVPPAPPPAVAAPAAPPPIVAMDACKFTLGEAYRLSEAKGLMHALSIKILRSHQNGITGCPTVADLAPCRVEQPAIPESASAAFAKFLELLKASEFLDPVWYELRDDFNAVRFHVAVFAHPSGQQFAQLTCRTWQQVQPARQSFILALISALDDGGYAMTAADKGDLNGPAKLRKRYVGANVSVRELLERHAAHVMDVKVKVRPIADTAGAARAAEEFHTGLARHYLARKIFRPLTTQERALLQGSRISGEHAEHSDVLLEMNRQSSKRTHPAVALALFVVSVAAFVHVQKATMSLNTIGLLVGVVFFHELGHFLAMKIFRYRDVRMYFIPFFGAVVIGRKPEAPGWQQALVALAGPLPGIAVGVGLGIAGLMQQKPCYPDVAKMLLVINVLNLIPILPLDGGRLLQAVIFSRSPIMDVIFKGLGAAACITFGAISGERVILFIGVSLAISLPITFRVARIANELRKGGGLPGTPDANANTPPQAAGVIIARLRGAFKANQNRRTLATFATQIYGLVSAPPPSALASVALLMLYVCSGVIGTGFGVFLLVGSPTNFSRLARAINSAPSHTVDVSHLQSWDGPASCAQHQHITVVATFPKEADAQQSFTQLQAELPATGAARLCGDTVFVMLPSGNDALRKEWFGKLDAQTKGVFVLQSMQTCNFKLQAVALSPGKAEEAADELNSYFTLARLHAIAPWDPADTRDEATRARNDAARRTYTKLMYTGRGVDSLEERALLKKITTATREGDKAEEAKLQKQLQELSEQRRQQHIADVRKLPYANTEVIDAFVEHDSGSAKVVADDDEQFDETQYLGAQKKFEAKLSSLIGQMPAAERSKDRPWSVSCQFGSATAREILIDVPYCSVPDVANTLPAMAQWLAKRGVSVKYELMGAFGSRDLGN
jgi:Zn-dependent protease